MKTENYVHVKDILKWYEEGGINLLETKINDPLLIIEPNTWCMHIKTSFERNLKHSISFELDILLLKYKNL